MRFCSDCPNITNTAMMVNMWMAEPIIYIMKRVMNMLENPEVAMAQAFFYIFVYISIKPS
jgi:hypothetical protein